MTLSSYVLMTLSSYVLDPVADIAVVGGARLGSSVAVDHLGNSVEVVHLPDTDVVARSVDNAVVARSVDNAVVVLLVDNAVVVVLLADNDVGVVNRLDNLLRRRSLLIRLLVWTPWGIWLLLMVILCWVLLILRLWC
jgi:hypothetical protein